MKYAELVNKLRDSRSYTARSALSKLSIRGMYSQSEILEKTGDFYKLNSEAQQVLISEFVD